MNEPIAVSLRSSLYRPKEILQFAKIVDSEANVRTIFFPDIPQGYDALNISSAVSALTSRVEIASGIIRPLEYEPSQLARLVSTLELLSDQRFILGVGTGHPGSNPSETIAKMMKAISEVKSTISSKFPELKVPRVLVAALRHGIASRVLDECEGILLNFCSADYASKLLARLESKFALKEKTIACYLKILYAKEDRRAKKLLLEEFVHYDAIPWYHKMFETAGAAPDISKSAKNIEALSSGDVPEKLLQISLSNPTAKELSDFVENYRSAGVNLPIVYPYFSKDEETGFKERIIRSIGSL